MKSTEVFIEKDVHYAAMSEQLINVWWVAVQAVVNKSAMAKNTILNKQE